MYILFSSNVLIQQNHRLSLGNYEMPKSDLLYYIISCTCHAKWCFQFNIITDDICNSTKFCNMVILITCFYRIVMYFLSINFFAITCILSEVTKVTKFIEGDAHLLEDEEIKRLLQGGNSVY